jgi:ABC-type Fe3+/spermidine/putrescine transport system ATPase subunit
MSPVLRLRSVEKRFGDVVAVAPLDLDVTEGEFLGILGPSGCGKTTLLRMVAGLERATRGEIVISGQHVTHWPACKRPVNTVFQRYVLFPHLSVAENVAFGLTIGRKLSKAEIARQVAEALELVRLGGFEQRRAHEVSGGQAQRISLARALVNRPKVLVLDEPLSALDLKVRQDMQGELRRIHRESGATFLYVTHDQQEALSMADRVVVMNEGRIEQVGTPDEVYFRPATSFVAGFVGDANVLPVEAVPGRDALCVCRVESTPIELELPGPLTGRGAWLVLRPESLAIGSAAPGLPGRVVDIAFLGSTTRYDVLVADGMTLRVTERLEQRAPRFAVGDAVFVVHDVARSLIIERPERDRAPDPTASAQGVA